MTASTPGQWKACHQNRPTITSELNGFAGYRMDKLLAHYYFYYDLLMADLHQHLRDFIPDSGGRRFVVAIIWRAGVSIFDAVSQDLQL